MDELKKLREKVDEMINLAFFVNGYIRRLPPRVMMIDLYSLQDWLKNMRGYLDCMIYFGNELLPDTLY
jgi:hypothetical protein